MIEVLPQIRPLLAEDRLNELGPGTPNDAAKPLLQELEVELPKIAKDRACAQACVSGLWLYHDFLDEAHANAQHLVDTDGSYWHAILHRREPDYANAKYWFRRVRTHPILAELTTSAATLAKDAGTPAGSEFLLRQRTWTPADFVDLCQAAARGPDALNLLCRRIQKREWELLFGHCHQRAFQATR
jgi:hypothetical protein